MPRLANPVLEQRILRAATRLWHQGGEQALSMRAVAKAAGTNTPAVYRRFENREAILRALVRSYQDEMRQLIEPCSSIEEVGGSYLNFALKRPREYQLIMSGLLARVSKTRPNVDFLLARCSEWLGGPAEKHKNLVVAIWSLVHGLATLETSGTLRREDFPQARAAVESAIRLLIANAHSLGN